MRTVGHDSLLYEVTGEAKRLLEDIIRDIWEMIEGWREEGGIWGGGEEH
jgi:hypothetical protein